LVWLELFAESSKRNFVLSASQKPRYQRGFCFAPQCS
jgi:hypothetical protein